MVSIHSTSTRRRARPTYASSTPAGRLALVAAARIVGHMVRVGASRLHPATTSILGEIEMLTCGLFAIASMTSVSTSSRSSHASSASRLQSVR